MVDRTCVDCGFLAVRNGNNGQLMEADHTVRENGSIGTYYGHTSPPVCLVMAANLPDEIYRAWRERTGARDERGQGYNPFDAQSVIQKPDRNCPKWRRWQQGFTPKEHREMLDRAEMLRRQEERDKNDREFRLTMEKLARTERRKLAWLAGAFILIGALLPLAVEALQRLIRAYL
ncbi:MAG: hypothetical protein HYX93_00825 [Chloroflexi bacterium]|nr:hypothetical protein [Chloroflexota bacterium]